MTGRLDCPRRSVAATRDAALQAGRLLHGFFRGLQRKPKTFELDGRFRAWRHGVTQFCETLANLPRRD